MIKRQIPRHVMTKNTFGLPVNTTRYDHPYEGGLIKQQPLTMQPNLLRWHVMNGYNNITGALHNGTFFAERLLPMMLKQAINATVYPLGVVPVNDGSFNIVGLRDGFYGGSIVLLQDENLAFADRIKILIPHVKANQTMKRYDVRDMPDDLKQLHESLHVLYFELKKISPDAVEDGNLPKLSRRFDFSKNAVATIYVEQIRDVHRRIHDVLMSGSYDGSSDYWTELDVNTFVRTTLLNVSAEQIIKMLSKETT